MNIVGAVCPSSFSIDPLTRVEEVRSRKLRSRAAWLVWFSIQEIS
jgi:hypothetical protein